MADTRGRDTDELEDVELVVDLDEKEPRARSEEAPRDEADPDAPEEPRREIRLSREQTLQDLRELQELSIERAEGRSPKEED